jgi:hypothetical protein
VRSAAALDAWQRRVGADDRDAAKICGGQWQDAVVGEKYE